ncbi:HPr family phosphocarrier protein [Paenibacillus thailandensis]|uniref:HPr family phosphocarrier protein n=1 Tax=Paenibacillus thailandensis TaxID=393250 RepID=A0ABW5R0V7_9BACL
MRVHEFAIGYTLEREALMDISRKASRFVSDIVLKFEYSGAEHAVDVKSLLGILLLPIQSGVSLRLETKGEDELEALEYVLEMFEKQTAGGH